MKLWYQSLIRPLDKNNNFTPQLEATPFGKLLRKLLNQCASPGTEIHIEGLSNSSGMGVHYRFLEYSDTKEIIYNAIRAEKKGFDAYLVGNISDAGLREAREMVNIPVLGACESTLLMACMMGATFGLITISEKWTPRIVENVRRCGLQDRYIGSEALDTSPLELKKAVENKSMRDAILADISVACKRLLKRGAEVIIPAGGDVVVFLTDAGIYEVEGAPILVSHAAMVKMAEAAVNMKAMTGVFTSKHLQSAPPTGAFLARVRDFYGPDIYPGAE